MRIAVMQPYLFPYLGYFQLVNAVDRFVFFDDVHFIKKGWINRNQILINNEPYRFTVPLVKVSQNKLINEIEIADYPAWRDQFLKQLENGYKKSPYFLPTFQWIGEFLFGQSYKSIGLLAADSVAAVSKRLGISTEFLNSSSLPYNSEENLDGQTKVLRICEMLKAETYINPKNGTELYDAGVFKKRNIQLYFIWMNEMIYSQNKPDAFVPYLSILDVLMFNSIEKTSAMLNHFELKQN